MKRLIVISTLCFAAILIGACCTLVDGIICGSTLGIALSVACIVTIFIFFKLFKKMLTTSAED